MIRLLENIFGPLIQNLLFFILHVNTPGRFPKALSAAEEKECLKKMKQGDIDARNTLIEHNLRLVVHISKKYFSAETDPDDLVSIGTIGLIKAVSTFNGEKSVRFATYASRCIENATLSSMSF